MTQKENEKDKKRIFIIIFITLLIIAIALVFVFSDSLIKIDNKANEKADTLTPISEARTDTETINPISFKDNERDMLAVMNKRPDIEKPEPEGEAKEDEETAEKTITTAQTSNASNMTTSQSYAPYPIYTGSSSSTPTSQTSSASSGSNSSSGSSTGGGNTTTHTPVWVVDIPAWDEEVDNLNLPIYEDIWCVRIVLKDNTHVNFYGGNAQNEANSWESSNSQLVHHIEQFWEQQLVGYHKKIIHHEEVGHWE